MLQASVRATFNPVTARNQLARQLRDQIAERLKKLASVLEPDIKQIVLKAIVNSPEWRSLHGGELQGLLGLDAEAVQGLDALLDIWAGQISVVVRKAVLKSSGDINGGVSIKAIEANMAEIVNNSASAYVSLPSGSEVPFMALLLTKGNEALPDYDVLFSTFFADISRSAQGGGPSAIMVSKEGASFRLPPQWANGTTRNNFITRAIQSIRTQIEQTIQRRFREIM